MGHNLASKMIGLFAALLLSTIRVGGSTDSDETAIRRTLLGTWKLVLIEDTLKDGSKRYEFGPHPKGFLTYSADGYMCATLMNPDRPKWQNPGSPTQADKASAFDGFFGYCGRYEIDTTKSELIHLPEVSSGPGFIGTRQVRPYRFEGNQLIFSGGAAKDLPPDVIAWRVVWEKVK
jgi:hypothetical protein